METIEAVGKSQSMEELLQVKILIVYLKCSNKWLHVSSLFKVFKWYAKVILKKRRKTHVASSKGERLCEIGRNAHPKKLYNAKSLRWGVLISTECVSFCLYNQLFSMVDH